MSGQKYEKAATQFENNDVVHPDSHMALFQQTIEESPDVVALIMTQLSLKAGLKQWGPKARKSAKHEMKQLHLQNTFMPKNWRDLSEQQKAQVLESHMFLKKKRNGDIKGRTVAGGNKQRDCMSKEDASSPTVATESVLLSSIIDAEEERDVAVIDIPNAFIQTRVEDEKDMVIIRVRGVLVDLLLEIAPEVYGPFVTADKKGVKQLLLQCANAMHGTMVASMLYCAKFCKTLAANGFELNPHDKCVGNRMVDGKQQTILWHVDDCKLSGVKSTNDALIEALRSEGERIFYDGTGQMTVSRGKVHKFLGMTLDYTTKGQVKVTMPEHMEECIKEFEKIAPDAKGTKSSAAPSNLFTTNDKSEKLSPKRAEQFHRLVAKILFATKRARPDTGLSISYLTTRVRSPNQDDWNKLVHLIKYIRGTKDLPLMLSADGSGVLKWHVDASHGVHTSMRGHTGGGLTMGTGFPIMTSTKQKLNTRSSTETETVGVDDVMPGMLWSRLFLEAQGCGVNENIVFQDNQAAMLSEKNGKASSGERAKHINMGCFFATDQIAKGRVSVVWCPAADMTGELGTEPVQGALFRKFRDRIMGQERQPDPGPGKAKKGRSEEHTSELQSPCNLVCRLLLEKKKIKNIYKKKKIKYND